jgi:hypothetical protein
MRKLWRPLAALAFWALALPADAADAPVDLELVLAIDVSGSIDEEEAALQREGYMAALVDAEVISAIRSGPTGRIAIAYVEWSNAELQRTVVEWRAVDGLGTAREFVAALQANPPVRGRFTSISGAIDYAVPMFQGNGFEGTRKAIDISGDGPNNRGRRVTDARDEAVARGITINGLPIVNDRPNFFGRPPVDLDLYYRDCVIGGPGALYVVAKDFHSFAEAIRRKLILEISGVEPAPGETKPLLHLAADEPSRCEMGESEFRGRFYQPYRN